MPKSELRVLMAKQDRYIDELWEIYEFYDHENRNGLYSYTYKIKEKNITLNKRGIKEGFKFIVYYEVHSV